MQLKEWSAAIVLDRDVKAHDLGSWQAGFWMRGYPVSY
jgi:hypothetical protein